MLTKAEMDAGVPILEAKVATQRPEAVCLVGKSIWEAVWRVRKGRGIKKEEFKYGWQDESENMGRVEGWNGAPVFVATTTSGLAAGMTMAEKQAVWNELGRWVAKRRKERKAAVSKTTSKAVDTAMPVDARQVTEGAKSDTAATTVTETAVSSNTSDEV